MNVKISEIMDNNKVKVIIRDNKIIANWEGNIPKKDENYAVEIDIPDELIWGKSIFRSDLNNYLFVQNEDNTRIVALLDYVSKDNLATLILYDSVLLIDIDGLDKDLSHEWVEINCKKISLTNINL